MRAYRAVFLLAIGSAALCAQSFNFLPGATYLAGNGSFSAVSGDFNGDGKPDIAVANISTNSISIFVGGGDGTFTAGTPLAVPGCLVAFVGAADFNRDGHIDLLAACEYQAAVYVLPGTGNGTFGSPIRTALPQINYFGLSAGNFQNIALGDFNNDGIPDLLIGFAATTLKPDSLSLNLLLGAGDGTFQTPTLVFQPSTFLADFTVVGDFNRDGNLDIAAFGSGADPDVGVVEVLLGTGKGTFQTPKTFPPALITAFGAATVADVNRDGIPDIVVSGTGVKSSSGVVCVYLGAGDGTFNLAFNAPETANDVAVGMLSADLRGTGNLDLVEAVGNFENLAHGMVSLTLEVWAGNGDGTFQNPVPMAFPAGLQPWPYGMLAGDWAGNGARDLAFAAVPSNVNLANKSTSDPLVNAVASVTNLPAGDLVVIPNGIAPPLSLAVSKNQLQFAYVAGGTAPLAQSVATSGAGTLNWTATSDSSWLAVSPASGTGAGNLSVSIAPAGLTPATYTGRLKISANGAANSPQTVTVTLTISAPSTAPVITAVVNGASFQPGIESGSWVTILGSNLSNTSPGRIWKASEIVNGNLPQSLDGASVTIDGKAAYVYYISPGQLNVQAPTDSANGNVAVVVTNNSQRSAAFAAQLETASPAFFLYPGTSSPIVSHFPDYGLVGTASAPAHPGDVLILWATGFGPTNPVTPAGIVVTGAPAAATLPAITVGGAQVPVSAAVLTPGTAGLYQIAIQLPSTVPTGTVTIEASVGGAMSPAGTTIVVQ